MIDPSACPCGACPQRVIQPPPLVSTGPGGIDGHVHLEHHQLIVCQTGTFVIEIGGRSWVASPSVAVWIPAGTYHSLHTARASSLASAYLCARHTVGGPTQPTLLRATDLLAGLLGHLDNVSPGSREEREAASVLIASIDPLGLAVDIRLPRDERALAIGVALLANPSDPRSLTAWGRTVSASVRTLSRLFVAETGLTFVQWRSRVRLQSSLAHLADGASVAVTAHRVGYGTASAYIEAFRRWTGTTPHAFAHERRGA